MQIFKSIALLLLLSAPAMAELKTINKPGQKVDVAAQLAPGRAALVYFHLSANALSRRIFADLPELASRRPELDILVVELNQLNSPVAQQYHVATAPYVQEYDVKGQLVDDGVKAYNNLTKMLQSR